MNGTDQRDDTNATDRGGRKRKKEENSETFIKHNVMISFHINEDRGRLKST